MAVASVTVRELRQNLSVYLERVGSGETLSVTKRGTPVAVLAPLPGRGSTLDRLIAEGRLTAPAGDIGDLPPPVKPRTGQRPLSEIVDEMREDKI